jgi:hypothetical protein
MSDPREADADGMPADEELEKPSTEKEPDEEPTDGDSTPDDVDHEAVGIGVIDSQSVDSGEGGATPPHPTAAETAIPDDAPPTDAASDEVRSDAAGLGGADDASGG